MSFDEAYERGVARAAREREIAIVDARERLARLEAKPERERFHKGGKADGGSIWGSDYPEMAMLRAQVEAYDREVAERLEQAS